MAEKLKAGRPNKEQIQAWKVQHNVDTLHQITVEDKIVILRPPGIIDLERALASDPKKQKPYNFNRSILSNCKLYADDGILEDKDTLMAVFAKLDEIVEIKDAEITKL
jgi:hypothetical protein